MTKQERQGQQQHEITNFYQSHTYYEIAELWGDLIFRLLNLLPLIVRNLTIPTIEPDSYSKLNVVLFPFAIPIFFYCFFFTKSHFGGFLVFLIFISTPLSLWFYLVIKEGSPPTKYVNKMILLSISFLMGSLWIYLIAGELVSVIEYLGEIWKIPSSLLGLTLLAWGNSLGDLITNVSIAKAGLGQMAIAGCFGGPTFNLLIGLGLSFCAKSLYSTNGEGWFPLKGDARAMVTIIFLLIALLINAIIARVCNLEIGKLAAKFLFAFYLTFTLSQILMLCF